MESVHARCARIIEFPCPAIAGFAALFVGVNSDADMLAGKSLGLELAGSGPDVGEIDSEIWLVPHCLVQGCRKDFRSFVGQMVWHYDAVMDRQEWHAGERFRQPGHDAANHY